MKPKEMAIYFIRNYLEKELIEKGFSFKEHILSFERKIGDFKNVIEFQGSKNNYENGIANFRVVFHIHNNEYLKWLNRTFENLPKVKYYSIIGNKSPLVKFKDRENKTNNYDFCKMSYEQVYEHLKFSIENEAIPYFEMNSSWRNLVENFDMSKIGHPESIEVIDAYLLTKQFEKASNLCELCINELLEFYSSLEERERSENLKEFFERRKIINLTTAST